MGEIRRLEGSLGEVQKLYDHAKRAAQNCNEDAEHAMQELRYGQAIQTQLQSAVEQLNHLYDNMQAVSRILPIYIIRR